jgi:hypothetical protein
LPLGQVSAGAGVSGQFAFRSGEPRRPPPPGEAEQAELEGTVERAALSPGIAPWVGARAGLGARMEGGLAYTGRAARIDVRRAFGSEKVAVSVGAGASAIFFRGAGPDDVAGPRVPDTRIPPGGGPDLQANGFGFDLPLLLGYRSTASVVQAWVGARGGMERISGELPLMPLMAPGPPPAPASLLATRWYGGGLVGVAIGLAPIYVAFELDVAYQAISGTASFEAAAGPARRDATVTGVTLAPAGAIVGKF